LQAALERAYRHWPRACQSGEPERYVRKILANASTDRWRQLARRPEQALLASHGGPTVQDRAGEVADRTSCYARSRRCRRVSVPSSCCATSTIYLRPR
jgi:DNA-directed RNA polymerase specialized sigma24 family protein